MITKHLEELRTIKNIKKKSEDIKNHQESKRHVKIYQESQDIHKRHNAPGIWSHQKLSKTKTKENHTYSIYFVLVYSCSFVYL